MNPFETAYRLAVLALLAAIAIGTFSHSPAPPPDTSVAAVPPGAPSQSPQVKAPASPDQVPSSLVKSVPSVVPPSNPTQLSDADMVHKALQDHPEWVMEAYSLFQRKQQEAQAARAKEQIVARHDDLFAKAGDPVVGAADADVTVVEFFDYECPYCKRIAPSLKQLTDTDKKVRVVYKEFPILGPISVIAAKAALAAQVQDKYEAFHNAMIGDQTAEHQLTEDHIIEIATAQGLDLAKLKADMGSPDIDAKINANRQLAQAVGISGTPGVIIGTDLAPGALPYEELVRRVAEVRRHSSQ